NLGNDTTANICPGFPTDLTTFKNTTGLTTQWIGTTTPTNVGAGVYTLIVTNTQGCKDTAVITINLNPKPNLGNDTTANICAGNTMDITSFKNTTGLTTQWIGTTTPTNVGAGVYTLIVTNTQGCKDTAIITLNSKPKPNTGADTSIIAWLGESVNLKNLRDTTGFAALGWNYSWWSSQNGYSGNLTVIVPDTGKIYATLTATSQFGCIGTPTNVVIKAQDSVLPASGALTLVANVEVTNPITGWTNYYNNNNTPNDKSDDILLLSLQKNGNNIGSIGAGAFSVTNAATTGAGSGTGIQITNPLMSNFSGYYTMRRYWQVTPNTQPTTNVGVRFYYNTGDFNDANGSFGGTKTMQQLVFYHLLNGNPNPTSNWSGATSQPISITYGATPNNTTWTYTNLGKNHHRAEFTVSSFSGGSGGFTGNNGPLPIELLTFNGIAQHENASLSWETGVEQNTVGFDLERSLDGRNFTKVISLVALHGNAPNHYAYIDQNVASLGSKLFYRLKLKDLNGLEGYSSVLELRFGTPQFEVSILPNPTDGIFIVKGSEHYTSLQIIDIHGRVLKEQTLGMVNAKIDITSLASGVYTVRVFSEGIVVNIKLIKE
ncbi:MAG: T9SS type A sorting domain-containing protein, partial [Bacteroidetes bacterium]|nr:T9SS type A sorting domain-containing protein [Bacteroidota bacterium]